MALSREDWIEHGLEALAEGGAKELKAERLASRLGITRGSFYWNFADLAEFHQAIVEAWSVRAFQLVVEQVEQASAATSNPLQALMRRIMTTDQSLERAIRAWAAHEKAVAKGVEQIDQQRRTYLEAALSSQGLSRREAKVRATFIYWAYLGQLVLGEAAFEGLRQADMDQLSSLMQTNYPGK